MLEKSLAVALMEKFHDDREKMERYIALAELCPLPAFMVAHDQATVVYINPAYRVLTGRNLSELQGGRWLDLVIHPDDRAEVAEKWKMFTETSKSLPHRHRYINTDGQVTDAVTILERIEGNGFVGFILPRCDTSFECPITTIYKMVSPAGL